MAQDTPEGPRKRLRVGHISERGGVNAVRALLESHGHVVDEVDGRSDYGRDLNVDITESAEITGVVIGIQVKGDRRFIKDYWWELPTSDKDRYYWAESGVPVVGILWDPGTGEMRWVNLTEYARYRRAGGPPISQWVNGYESFSPDIVHFHKEQVLNEETLPRMMSAMRGYAQLHFSPRMLNILDVFSLDPERSFSGVLYCWVVAHTDGRALLLLRRALPALSGDALAKAIELLSMIGGGIRWVSDDISSEVLGSFRWSAQEVSYLVKETGRPCKLVSLLAVDPELDQIVLATISLAVSQGDQNCAFLLWILYRHLPGWRPGADDAALIQHPELLHSPRVQAELDQRNDVDEFWGIPLELRCGECGASFSERRSDTPDRLHLRPPSPCCRTGRIGT